MVLKSDKVRLKKMISDSIVVLCRAGLPFQSKFEIQALIGITLDDNDVVLVNINETLLSDSLEVPLEREEIDDDETGNIAEDDKDVCDDDQQVNTSAMKMEEKQLRLNPTTNGNRCKVPSRKKFKRSDEFCKRITQKISSNSKLHMQQNESVQDEHEGLECDSFDGNFASGSQYHPNFPDELCQKYFPTQVKVEDNNTDDCMIVKSEHPDLTETYEIDDDQTWNEQIDEFDGSSYLPWQAAEVSDTKPFAQESNWLPRQTAEKFKMPLKQRRQTWIKPSGSYTKSKYMDQTAKLQTKSLPSVGNEESDSAIDSNVIGRPVLQCAYCNAVFNRPNVLKEHVNGVHFKKKLFHCPDCGESFKWRADLSRHRRVPGLCPCKNLGNQEWPDQV